MGIQMNQKELIYDDLNLKKLLVSKILSKRIQHF